MDEVLRIVMEALLKAGQKGLLGYANGIERIKGKGISVMSIESLDC